MEQTLKSFAIPVEALGLKDIELVKVELTRANELIITVASTKKEIPCHKCGRPTEPHGKGQTVRLRHLPILGKKHLLKSPHREVFVPIVMIIQHRHNYQIGMIEKVLTPKHMSNTCYYHW